MQPTSVTSPSTWVARIRLPGWALILIAVVSVQIGASIAKSLFDTAGPEGVVFLRTSLAALLFYALWRPKITGYTTRQYIDLLLFGINIAVMMLSFYAAIDLIPLGIAVAIAFAGPLGIAVIGSRRPIDFFWVIVAGIGILLLSPLANVTLNPVGMLLAIASAVTWATYIYINKRVSRVFPAHVALPYGMMVAALTALPIGGVGALSIAGDLTLMAVAVIVALFSSMIPFALEYKALETMPPRVFGLLVSTEPVVATLIGLVVLQEAIGPREAVGIMLVTIAAVATTRGS